MPSSGIISHESASRYLDEGDVQPSGQRGHGSGKLERPHCDVAGMMVNV